MFINTIKFNKYIKWKKYTNLLFTEKKISLYLQIYNTVDYKALKNFVFLKKNYLSKLFFFKNLNFKKKSDMHMWWFYKIYKNFNIQFIPRSHYLMKIQTIFDFTFKKLLYNSSKGNFVFFLYTNFSKNRNFFRYPSKKILILPFFVFSFFNRKQGFYKRKSFLRFFKYKKKKKVRGIAQNPVDHHNGGRSKTKKPFFNKYNHIAKNNK